MPKKNDEYSYEQEFLDWDTDARISWATGLICMALGRGDVRTALYTILDRAQRSSYHYAKGDIKSKRD